MRPLRFALLVALALGAGSQARAATAEPALQQPELEPGASDAALRRALTAIEARSVRGDVDFLASDVLAGRGTPSPEQRIASLYLRARFERFGLVPGARGGEWFAEVAIERRSLDLDASRLMLVTPGGGLVWHFGDDYVLASFAQLFERDASGPIVCAGDGRGELPAEVRGRWVLVLDSGRVPRDLDDRLLEAGATGMILAPGPDYDRAPYAERFSGTVRALREGGMSRLEAASDPEPPQADSVLGQVLLSARALAQLVDVAFPGRILAERSLELGEELPVLLRERRVPKLERIAVRNVCAWWPGSDPELAREALVVSAHYDHLGRRGGEIYPGADDNASGTAGLLALAEALAAHGPFERSILLLGCSAEENGLWGSQAWCEDPWLPNGAVPVANLNLDMIGRTAPDELYVTPSRALPEFNVVAERCYELAHAEGFAELREQDQYWRASDHYSFAKLLRLPVAYLSSGDHAEYHKPTDVAALIDADKIARTARLVVRVIDALQAPDALAKPGLREPADAEDTAPDPAEPVGAGAK